MAKQISMSEKEIVEETIGKTTKVSHPKHIPSEWKKVADKVKEGDRIMVIGGVDAGKTSFCIFLEEKASETMIKKKLQKGDVHKIALIDLDPGQQNISLPGCVSMKIKEIAPLRKIWGKRISVREKFFSFFVGRTTPKGSFHLILSALNSFKRKAEEEKVSITILDTSGYIGEDEAVLFKLLKAKTFNPTKIIFISEEKGKTKIERILSDFEVIKVRPSPLSRKVSIEQRAEIRVEKIKRYFLKTARMKIKKDEKIIHISRPVEMENGEKNTEKVRIAPGSFLDVIAFFRGDFTEFLGLVEEEKGDELTVIVPEKSKRKKWDFGVRKTMKI